MHYTVETDTVLWRQNFTHIIPDDDDDGYGTWCWRRGTWEWFPPRDRWLWGTICPLSLLPHPPCTWEQWGPVLLFPTSDASLASSSALSSCSLNAGLSIIFLGFACCCQSVSFCIFIRGCLFCHFSLYFLSRGFIFSSMVVHFSFAQSSRTSFYTAFSPRHRVQVRMSQDLEENKHISIQLEQNGMSTGCFCIFGNK